MHRHRVRTKTRRASGVRDPSLFVPGYQVGGNRMTFETYILGRASAGLYLCFTVSPGQLAPTETTVKLRQGWT